MKVRFIHWYNAILTALLSMLGYGCSTTSNEPEMYGTPTADYIFKGRVTDEAGVPIQGIKTSLKQVFKSDDRTYVEGLDSVLTGASGDYQLKYGGIIGQIDHHSKLIVEDVDGEANGGKFLSDTIDIDFKNNAVQIKNGDSGWYEGTYEISQDIRLKKNTDEGPKASE